jgi:hypothetical protein
VKKYETIATNEHQGFADAVWDKNENEQECEKRAEIPFSVAMKTSGGRFCGGALLSGPIVSATKKCRAAQRWR